MGLNNAGDFNLACEEGHATDLINVAEALQEKKIAQIADTIFHRGENGNRVKLVLIAGPSSSGKTTFSKRLSIQLMTNGLKPFPISLDNYFVDREETPLDENGNYDYESLYALDLELFNQQLQALLRGEEVELPRFNFSLGKKEYKGDKLKIEDILHVKPYHAGLVYVPVKTNGYSLIRKMLMSCLIQRYFLSLPYFVYTLSLF